MKIIEALKKLKDLDLKAKDLRDKVQTHSAYANFETPRYPDQKQQVRDWLQAHRDVLFEIEKLSYLIQKTNVTVKVKIDVMRNGTQVEKTIAQWIMRRRKLAELERISWQVLNDKNIKEGLADGPSGKLDIKIMRCYDPAEKDSKMESLRSEPMYINAALEIVNATTDLLDE